MSLRRKEKIFSSSLSAHNSSIAHIVDTMTIAAMRYNTNFSISNFILSPEALGLALDRLLPPLAFPFASNTYILIVLYIRSDVLHSDYGLNMGLVVAIVPRKVGRSMAARWVDA